MLNIKECACILYTLLPCHRQIDAVSVQIDDNVYGQLSASAWEQTTRVNVNPASNDAQFTTVLESTVHEIAPPENNPPDTVGAVCIGVHLRGGHACAER